MNKRRDCTIKLNPINMSARNVALNQLYEKVMDTKIHDPAVKDLLLKMFKLARLKGGGL